MGFLLGLIPTRAKLIALGVAALAIAAKVIQLRARREGRKELQQEQLEDRIERVDAGRAAAQDAEEWGRDKTGEERLARLRERF